MTTLSEISSADPSREIRLKVDLKQIHRGPDVEQLLEGFDLRVTNIGFKHVGSGGGGFGVQFYDSFSEYFRTAERNYVSRLASMAGVAVGNLPPCEIDDKVAPVVDTHGMPASKLREAACGLRIHKLELTGTAASAFEFVSSNDPRVAVARLEPSAYDMMRLIWHTRPNARSEEGLDHIRAKFPEFDPEDFPQ